MRKPGKGVKGNPLATSTLRGSSVAQTNLRYKEVHLNEVYGCAYTPYLGYQKLRTDKLLKSQEMELENLENLTQKNADLKDFIANEQNRINNVTDELELDYDDGDGFDFER